VLRRGVREEESVFGEEDEREGVHNDGAKASLRKGSREGGCNKALRLLRNSRGVEVETFLRMQTGYANI